MKNEFNKFKKPYFNYFDKVDLLKSFAGLQVLPQNHGKNIRLEHLMQEVLISPASYGKKIVYSKGIRNYLDKHYANNSLEDAPTNLFTELITFRGGDYIIFPGITESTSFITSNLLNSIFHFPNKIPNDFKSIVFQASIFILSISDNIADKLDYERYIKEDVISGKIELPNNANLNPLKESVFFTQSDFDLIIKRFSINPQILDYFITTEKEIEDTVDLGNLIINKPIIFIRGNYIVLSPTTISAALTHFIWGMAESLEILDAVVSAFHSAIWQNSRFALKSFGYSEMELPGFKRNSILPIKESFFQFDDDKVAYVVFQFDTGQQYSENPYFFPDISLGNAIDKRREEVIKYLSSIKEVEGFSIFNLNIFSPIGRGMALTYDNIENVTPLGISASELHKIFESENRDRLDLWNFAQTNQKGLFSRINPSTLDRYVFYKDHDDSLYVSDESKPSEIFVMPGHTARHF